MRGRSAALGGVAAMVGRAPSLVAAPRAGAESAEGAEGVVVGGGSKRERQRTIRELVASEPIGSQQELADRLTASGFTVTQATVSRDIAELGLIKAARDGRHAYVAPETFAGSGGSGSSANPSNDRLIRILSDIPVTIGRSGLILLITGSPGTASVIAQAIDESSLTEQEGTLAGDNTLLVLFADEARLLGWRDRFNQIRSTAREASPA